MSKTNHGGLIIKIDGIDGCGKGTLIENLYAEFATKLRVVKTQEFRSEQDNQVLADTSLGTVSRMLYEFVLNPRLEFDPMERQLAMIVASHRQNRLVLPKLRETYDLILSDRSSLSRAYGYELGEKYQQFLTWALDPVLQEDWIFWIDTEAEIAFARTKHNTEFVLESYAQDDTIEAQGLQHQRGINNAYRVLAEKRKNVIRLDGSLGIPELTAVAVAHINRLLQPAR